LTPHRPDAGVVSVSPACSARTRFSLQAGGFSRADRVYAPHGPNSARSDSWPTKCWPCKSNSVSLGSSPRAPEPRGRPSGLQAGSGRRARSPSLPPLSRLPRAFLPDPVRLGLLVEPEPLADVRHEAGHGATLCPSPETRLAIGSRSHGRNRRLASLQSLP
jgi:hypothetical protein